ncbi:MFS transporter [Desmospora activa]|uniref:MFS transporter n=1 Tax=Desmospora activa TaxID=500615 RepID=UPI000D321C9E|nr:MFS transporter [Desmospora activa]
MDISKAQVGMLPAALFLGQALFNLPAGWLADRFGSRRLLLTLAGWSAISFTLAATMSSFSGLLVSVILGGFAYGAMHPVTNRGILAWFARNRRGTAMGIKQMGITAGSALSALVLLPLALAWGWRYAMVAAAVLVLLVGSAAFAGYRDPSGNENSSPDRGTLWRQLREILHNRVLLGISLASFGLNMGNPYIRIGRIIA